MASNPQAKKFAREQLSFFFEFDDFVEERSIRRWAALSSTDPPEAAGNVRKALSGVAPDVRKRIAGQARRQLVWTLVRLAWNQTSFRDAVVALALLAEAENEKWSNNASAEFAIRFQIFLGGTAVPYLQRLEVLDELLATRRQEIIRLVVHALAQTIRPEHFRVSSDPVSDEVPEPEWRPRTNEEHFDCVKAGMTRLTDIAKLGTEGIEDALMAVAKDMVPMLREQWARNLVADFLDTVRENYPGAREPLRRAISEIIEYERHYWKNLSPEQLETLEQLHSRFENTSLASRLRQHVAQAPIDPEAQIDLKPLAFELVSDLDALAEQWPWLTSGDAANGWQLGQALAEIDSEANLAEKLPVLPGSGDDLRIISGYIGFQRKVLGDEWYKAWLTSQANRSPKPVNLLFDVAWRCGSNTTAALLLAELLKHESVSPGIVGHLGFGGWSQGLSDGVLERLLQAMTEAGHQGTAIAILISRINANPDELDRWKPLCLRLVMTPELIRGQHIDSFFWSGAARRLIAEHAREIAAAILAQHQNRDSGRPWLIAHSEAEKVLRACVEKDPTGVWQVLQGHLRSPLEAEIFSIGFPDGILASVPPDDIKTWILQQPEDRAASIAKFLGSDLSNDSTLAAVILGEFGDNEKVGGVFFNNYISGVSWGPISNRWNQHAQSLDEVAGRTKLPKLRLWAQKYADTVRRMAEEMRRREEEELHGR